MGNLTKKLSEGVLHQTAATITQPKPIENVWDELDRRVKEMEPTSAQLIENALLCLYKWFRLDQHLSS